MTPTKKINQMTLTAAAKIELIETALANGKYRTLQKQLKALRDEQQIILQGYLSDSHEALKAEAQRIILELKPITEAETQGETTTATVEQKADEVLASLPTEIVEQKINEVLAFLPTEIVEQKINEVLASLPSDTIVDNSDFGDRINTGNVDEKIWLVKKNGNGAGMIFVKTECGQYYESYAGDALRSIVVLGLPTFIKGGVLRTLVAVPDALRLQENAQKLGLTLYLYDRTNNTETPQDAINMQKLSLSDNQADTYPVPEDQINFFNTPREGLFHYNGRLSWDDCNVMGMIKGSETENPIYLVYGLGEYHLVEEVSFAVTYPVGYLKNGRIR